MSLFQTALETLLRTIFLTLGIGPQIPLLDKIIPFFGFETWSASAAAHLFLGAACGAVFSQRHNLVSQLSSVLQLAIRREKPKSVDETIPLVWITLLAAAFLSGTLMHRFVPNLNSVQPWVAYIVFLVMLGLAHPFRRQNKLYYDWSWKEALWIGLPLGVLADPTLSPWLTLSIWMIPLGRLRSFKPHALVYLGVFVWIYQTSRLAYIHHDSLESNWALALISGIAFFTSYLKFKWQQERDYIWNPKWQIVFLATLIVLSILDHFLSVFG